MELLATLASCGSWGWAAASEVPKTTSLAVQSNLRSHRRRRCGRCDRQQRCGCRRCWRRSTSSRRWRRLWSEEAEGEAVIQTDESTKASGTTFDFPHPGPAYVSARVPKYDTPFSRLISFNNPTRQPLVVSCRDGIQQSTTTYPRPQSNKSS